jgi:hypothetical protein
MQDYSVSSYLEEKKPFLHLANKIYKIWIFLVKTFCTRQSWGFQYYDRKLGWQSIKTKKQKTQRFFVLIIFKSLSWKRFVIKGKNRLQITPTWNWKMSIPLVTKQFKLFFLDNCGNWVQLQTLYVIFF